LAIHTGLDQFDEAAVERKAEDDEPRLGLRGAVGKASAA